MEIVKILPDEKYVLLLPGANMAQTEKIVSSLESFIKGDVCVVVAICGHDVTIVPASQIVGYKVLGDG